MKLYYTLVLSTVAVMTLAGTHTARAADVTSVSFRAICFELRQKDAPVLFAADGGARKPLEIIDTSGVSDPHMASVRDGRYVDFYTSLEPKEGEAPAVTITLPTGAGNDLLFVFAPSDKGLQAFGLNIPRDLEAGGSLMFNTTSAEIAVKMDKTKPILVKKGVPQVVPLPPGHKDAMIPVLISERRKSTDPWRIIQSSRWLSDKSFRNYLFLYRLAEDKPLRIYGVSERVD